MLNRLDAELRRELRSAYDGRIILGEFAEKTRTVANRQAIIECVQQFRDGEQADDITLAVARCH